MQRLIESLSHAEGKVRLDTLLELFEDLQKHPTHFELNAVPDLCAALAPCFGDNNVKIATTAAAVVEHLAAVAPEGSLRPHSDSLAAPITDLLGAAKPSCRDGAVSALLALIANMGPTAVFEAMCGSVGKGTSHRNWRVRAGVLSLYAQQAGLYAAQVGGGGAPAAALSALAANMLLGPACAALADAQPDFRRVAVDASAALALAVGLPRVSTRAIASGARPAQVKAIANRLGELEGGGDKQGAASSCVNAPSPLEAVAATLDQRGMRALDNNDQSPHALTMETAASVASMPTVQHEPGQDAIQAWSMHPAITSLCHMHSGPWWRPGVLGELSGDQLSSSYQPLLPSGGLRELSRFVEEFASTCAGTTHDWKLRVAALEKLRRYVFGGACSVEGFQSLLPRLRDPLCVQVQDLRSSIVKLACMVIAELSVALAATPWMEALADALVETLSKLTLVTINIISSSAHACIQTLLHNTRSGFHRVLPKLIVAARARSPLVRARAAEHLLQVLSGWAPPYLERHADELTVLFPALLSDADPSARANARLAYWSFAAVFPSRAESVLARLDSTAARLIVESESIAHDRARKALSLSVAQVHIIGAPPHCSTEGVLQGAATPRSATSMSLPPSISVQAGLQEKGLPVAGRVEGVDSLSAATIRPHSAAVSARQLVAAPSSLLRPASAVLIAKVHNSTPHQDSVAAEALLGGAVDALSAAVRVTNTSLIRSCIGDLFIALLRTRAIDPRSLARAYGARIRTPGCVLPSVSALLPQPALTEALASIASVSHVSYPPIVANVSPVGVAALLRLFQRPGAPLQRVLAATVMQSSLEATVADAQALLAVLTDTHVSLSTMCYFSVASSSNNDSNVLVSVLGQTGGAALSALLARGGLVAEVQMLPTDFPPLPVVLSVIDAGESKQQVVPVYALALFECGGADSFCALFSSVLHATVGSGEVARAAGRRALACLRRAYPVGMLLEIGLAAMSADRGPSLQTVCLHLLRDMLGDTGGGEFFGASETHTALLLERMAGMLSSAFASQGGPSARAVLDPANPSSPFHRLPALVDATVATLVRSHRTTLLAALALLSPEHLRAIVTVCDTEYGGSSAGLSRFLVDSRGDLATKPVFIIPSAPAVSNSSDSESSVLVIPLTSSNLELVLETLSSMDPLKRLRALHYFGRAIDKGAGGAITLATDKLDPIPLQHRNDAPWLTLLDRVFTCVVATTAVPPGVDAGTAAGPAGVATSPPCDPVTLSQTALSVIRKLFRNCTPYVGAKASAVVNGLLSALAHAPPELASVIQRTIEDVSERLPPDVALSHLVSSLDSGKDGSENAAALIASIRALTTLVPRCTRAHLLGELARGRLMEGVRRAFLSTSLDLRRAVVALLVALHGATSAGGAFARYTEAYLTPPQLKLLSIYIDKASGVAAPV